MENVKDTDLSAKAAPKAVVLDSASAAMRLIRDTEAAAVLGCSRASVWALVKAGTIPAPLKIGSMARWRLSDIQSVIDRAAERNAPKARPRPRERKRSFQ